MGPMRRSLRATLGLLVSSVILASCGGATSVPLLLGDPSVAISVPLNVANCDNNGTCFALGTTGLDIAPTTAAQVSIEGRSWHGIGTPTAPSTQLVASSCWSDSCLIGGSDVTGDVVWLLNSSAISIQLAPQGGLGVAAIDCYGPLSCSMIDSNANGKIRMSQTTDAGYDWSVPVTVPWSSSTSALSLACTSASSCVIGATTRQRTMTDTATWATTHNGGRTWSIHVNSSWTQLVDLYCSAQRCTGLATPPSGHNVVVDSSTAGESFFPARLQPSRNPGALSCSSISRCLVVGSTSVWMSKFSKNSWLSENLKYVPSPLVSVSCGATRCVSYDSQTTVLQKI